jgi:hypothetical protein
MVLPSFPCFRVFSVAGAIGSAVFLSVPNAGAAPCCAGSSAIPAIITGDDRAQFAASYAYGTVIGDAPADGLPVFRTASDSETTSVFRLDGALLLSDRWQAGLGLPFFSRSLARAGTEASANRMGDVEADVAYEVLPEWSYSKWRPRGHLFFGGAIPTGRSIYESELPGLVDATGKGFYRLQFGGVLTKRWTLWDVSLVAELHRSIPRTFAATPASPDSTRVDPGTGGSISVAGGVSPGGGNLRVGLRVQPNWNSGKSVRAGESRRDSSRTQTVDTALEMTYLAAEENGGTWTVFGSYTDQTLLGPARNATLSRTFAMGVQHRWDR